MAWRPILTAVEMREAENRVIAAGTPAEMLMERAGAAAADAIGLYTGPQPALVLCGPGNNGGDGYVIARLLAERGTPVRVAALGEPVTPAAIAARQLWRGQVERIDQAEPAPLLVDALFGTGLTRAVQPLAAEALARFSTAARLRVAVDLPSGVSSDEGAVLSPVPEFDLTVTFGSLKPAHLLQPAARYMGRIVVADIGVPVESRLSEIGRPRLRGPGPDDHKYSRGYVAVAAGEMGGAAALTAAAAARAGAGYVRLIGEPLHGLPHAVVQSRGAAAGFLGDPRIGALAIGPGLGRDAKAEALLDLALGSGHPLVLDADALVLLARRRDALREQRHLPVLTPHAGEFRHLFAAAGGSKLDDARRAAEELGAVMVYKGADTVVAEPGGRAAIAPPAPAWLASAGTGDVLTGIIAAMRASGMDAFEAACAGVWLHGKAASLAGPWLIADDLIARLPAALAGR